MMHAKTQVEKTYVIGAFGTPCWDRIAPCGKHGDAANPVANKEIRAFISDHALDPGCKVTVSAAEYQRLAQMITRAKIRTFEGAGGTASNILHNFVNLATTPVQAVLGGSVWSDPMGDLIRRDFGQAGIVLCSTTPAGYKTPVSLILLADGDRRIIKPPSMGEQFPDVATALRDAQAVVVIGQIAVKHPDVVSAMLDYCVEQNKTIIYTLPTDVNYTVNHKDTVLRHIEAAHKVLANVQELYGLHPTAQSGVIIPPSELPPRFNDLTNSSGQPLVLRPLTYVTDGQNGAYVSESSSQNWHHIPAVPGIQKSNTTGAGDSSFAALMIALHIGLIPQEAAKFAAHVAGHTIEVMPTRIVNPQVALAQRFPQQSWPWQPKR